MKVAASVTNISCITLVTLKFINYNAGQNCWDNCRFSPSPHYNVDFSWSPKSRSVHRSLACFNIVWGEGGSEKGSKRRTRIAHITMEACTVNFLLFGQNLTSVPKSFDPHCRHCWLTVAGLTSQTFFFEFSADEHGLNCGLNF